MLPVDVSGEERFMTPEDRGDWILTYTGKKFYVLDPQPEDICIADIAHSLANQCRFTGHCNTFFSVAQHCVHVSKVVPHEYAFAGLMHDASEAYITDVARPIKPYLKNYKELEDKVMRAIADKYNFQWPMPDVVKQVDWYAVVCEARALWKQAEWANTEYNKICKETHSDWGVSSFEHMEDLMKLWKKDCPAPKITFLERFYNYV